MANWFVIETVWSLFPPFTLSPLFILQAPSCRSSLLFVSFKEPVFEHFIPPQTKSTCAWIWGKAGSNRRGILAAVCLVFTFQHAPRPWLSPLRDAEPFCFSPHLCLSVWLVVRNIERCLFLLWLSRQGALWQTTRDQIDYAAFRWNRPNLVIVSGATFFHPCTEKISPGLMYLM